MTNIIIQPAQKEQSTQLHSILVECSRWLKKKKINQWQPVYHKARFMQETLRHHVYGCFIDDTLIGTVTLLPTKPDSYPFGIWSENKPVWYMCRLAVKREYIHLGLGKKILEEIERVAKINHITSLRLDIAPDRHVLRNYYLHAGYIQKFIELPYLQSIFFEKELV